LSEAHLAISPVLKAVLPQQEPHLEASARQKSEEKHDVRKLESDSQSERINK
jgi:hypothetical protein